MSNFKLNREPIWNEIKAQIAICQKCRLCETRNKTVPGTGNLNSKVVLIGEGPGAEEDMSGYPFVGDAGKLLTKILASVEIDREKIFITNVVKCRTDKDNRDPYTEEQIACSEFLEAQLLLIRPAIIITAGNIATKWLCKTETGITALHGQFLDWRGIKLFPIFHPSYLLRNNSNVKSKDNPRYLMWEDVKALRKYLDKENLL